MAKTGTLKDNATGEVIYPITLASNVYDANGNGIPSVYATKTELSNYASQPVLLWQNGNPNAQFTPQSITISSMSGYSIIRIGFKHWHESPTAVQYQDFKYEVGAYGTINAVQKYQLKSRGFSINSATKITFEAGIESNNNTTHGMAEINGQMVPVVIYGIK